MFQFVAIILLFRYGIQLLNCGNTKTHDLLGHIYVLAVKRLQLPDIFQP